MGNIPNKEQEVMKTVYLYVQNTMADWEAGYATAELRSGRFFRKGAAPLAVKTFSLNTEPVVSMGGLRILPDLAIDALSPEQAAILILPGADTWLESRQRGVTDMAAAFLDAGVPVAAICGATLALGQSGLLDDRPHTSNDLAYLKEVCPGYKGEKYYQNQPAVADGGLITASGAAPLEFARLILQRLDVFAPESLEAWFLLHKTQEPRYFHQLLHSLQTQ